MGYTHINNASIFVPPVNFTKSSGAWSLIFSSEVTQESRAASDTPLNILIPLNFQGGEARYQGVKIQSIDIYYTIGTADFTSFNTVEVCKQSLPANGVAHSGAEVPSTIDADHDTSAERVVQGTHKMTITITNPVYIQDDEFWYVYLATDPAATSVISLYGAQVHFTLRQ
jgi:hypothetical protein